MGCFTCGVSCGLRRPLYRKELAYGAELSKANTYMKN